MTEQAPMVPACLFLRRLGIGLAPPPATRDQIVRHVEERHGLPPQSLRGYLPRKAIPARDEAVWVLRQSRRSDGSCRNSLSELAKYFGLNNHTSILSAERRHAARRAEGVR